MLPRLDSSRYVCTIGLLATTINSKYIEQIRACRRTWVPHAEAHNIHVLFFGGDHVYPDVPVCNFPIAGETYNSCFLKQFLGLEYMLKNYPSDFYFFGGTDNYVHAQRLLKMLDSFDPNEKLYIGGHGWEAHIGNMSFHFHSGGGGFILSHALLVELFKLSLIGEAPYERWKCVAKFSGHEICACDVAIAYFLQDVQQVKVVNMQNFHGCSCYARYTNEYVKCSCVINWDTAISVHFMTSGSIEEYHRYNHKLDPSCNRSCTVVVALNSEIDWKFLNLDVQMVIYCPTYLRSTIAYARQGLVTHIFTELKQNAFMYMQDAIEKNVFATKHFVWLDSKLAHVPYIYAGQIMRIIENEPLRCCLPYIGFEAPLFFNGPIEKMKQLCDMCLHHSIQDVIQNDDLVRLWYGTDFALLPNYDSIRIAPEFILDHALIHQKLDVAREIIKSQGEKKCEIDLSLQKKLNLVV